MSDTLEVIAGHGRLAAANLLGLDGVPVIVLSDMTDADRRAYVIADNRLAELAGWDRDTLAIELQFLQDVQFDKLEVTGFSLGEIDLILDEASEKTPIEPGPENEIPAKAAQRVVSRVGDLWALGNHRLLCGDARKPSDYQRLLNGTEADVVLTDPPFNVPIEGQVSGPGKIKHRKSAMASGEMSERDFTDFLSSFLASAKACSKDGAILFVFMDWRHLARVISQGDLFAGGSVFLPEKAEWLGEFVKELLSFPQGPDDQVDALVQGLAWQRGMWLQRATVRYTNLY